MVLKSIEFMRNSNDYKLYNFDTYKVDYKDLNLNIKLFPVLYLNFYSNLMLVSKNLEPQTQKASCFQNNDNYLEPQI